MLKDNPRVPPHSYPAYKAAALKYVPWTRALVISGNLENQILRPHSKPVVSMILDWGLVISLEYRLQVMLIDAKV